MLARQTVTGIVGRSSQRCYCQDQMVHDPFKKKSVSGARIVEIRDSRSESSYLVLGEQCSARCQQAAF
jgi:hypothetical protein